MPKKRNYPKHFSPHSPPFLDYIKPEKIIIYHDNVDEIEISEGSVILPEHVGYTLDRVYDDSSMATFVKYEKVEKVNPQYAYQLLQYELDKKAHDIKLEEWKILKKKWDAELAEETKANELKQLEKLKKKYET